MDWFPTFVDIAGDPNVTEELKAGMHNDAMKRDYKVHLDGYDLVPFLTGETEQSPRKEVFYFSDDGDLTALRYGDWKILFMEQPVAGTFRVWQQPFVPMRTPFLYNLRRDPYERATITSNSYYEWLLDRAYLFVPAQTYVAKFLETFKEFPPRQKAASFSLDKVLEKMQTPGGTQ
jgi:arylsulfatase